MLDQVLERDDGVQAIEIYKKLDSWIKKLYPEKDAEQRLEFDRIILQKRFPEEM